MSDSSDTAKGCLVLIVIGLIVAFWEVIWKVLCFIFGLTVVFGIGYVIYKMIWFFSASPWKRKQRIAELESSILSEQKKLKRAEDVKKNLNQVLSFAHCEFSDNFIQSEINTLMSKK